jgi:hypothetical protein
VTQPGASARAAAATALFALAGLLGLAFSPHPWPARLPNALFYAVLVANTFFSVRFFAALPPADRDERLIDGLLVVAYCGLAAAIGAPAVFALVSTAVFALAIAKYALLFGVVPRADILRGKIAIDAMGLALCAATTVAAALGPPLWAAWVQAAVFAAANVYLLLVRPMYGVILDAGAPRPQREGGGATERASLSREGDGRR